MDYPAALEYLSSLRQLGVIPGTERLADVLRRLGDPQERFLAVHVAGTNGKGSTSAFAAALLGAAARQAAPAAKVGLYTSPHLARVRERVQLADPTLRECSEAELAAALSAVRDATERSPAVEITFFEVLTAAAFFLFAEQGVAVAVIETGLGGRLDATRLCRAGVTVITSIGLDHTELLGPTLSDIAREKAGIFRPPGPDGPVPALAACDDLAARQVIVDEARRVGAPLWLFATLDELPADVQPVPPLPAELAAVLPLAGHHQRRNAALAVAAVTRLPHPLGAAARDPRVQATGLAAAHWPGRLERLWPTGVPDAVLAARIGAVPAAGSEVWLDAAHNPEGAQALAAFLADRLGGRPLTVLFGAVAGKSVTAMCEPLLAAERLFLTRPPSPRGLPASELAALIDPVIPGRAATTQYDDFRDALRQAVTATSPGGLLLVYGSIFLVGAVRALWLGEAVDPLFLQDPAARPR